MVRRQVLIAGVLAVGGLLGWLTEYGQMGELFAQQTKTDPQQTKTDPQSEGTPKGAAQDDFDRSILPIPEPVFRGEIGITPRESMKDFPRDVKPPKGAPKPHVL